MHKQWLKVGPPPSDAKPKVKDLNKNTEPDRLHNKFFIASLDISVLWVLQHIYTYRLHCGSTTERVNPLKLAKQQPTNEHTSIHGLHRVNMH